MRQFAPVSRRFKLMTIRFAYPEQNRRAERAGGDDPETLERRARALLAAIVDSSDDAIISKTLDGIVMTWNPAAERMFGHTAEEMVGTSILKIIPDELQEEENRILAEGRAGKRVEHYRTERGAKEGHRATVSLTVSPIRDDSGAIVGASKIARDITGLREAERNQALLASIVQSS